MFEGATLKHPIGARPMETEVINNLAFDEIDTSEDKDGAADSDTRFASQVQTDWPNNRILAGLKDIARN
jgi:hypothetical protein